MSYSHYSTAVVTFLFSVLFPSNLAHNLVSLIHCSLSPWQWCHLRISTESSHGGVYRSISGIGCAVIDCGWFLTVWGCSSSLNMNRKHWCQLQISKHESLQFISRVWCFDMDRRYSHMMLSLYILPAVNCNNCLSEILNYALYSLSTFITLLNYFFNLFVCT